LRLRYVGGEWIRVPVTIVVIFCYRSALLAQLFAVVDSDPLTLVAYAGRLMSESSIVDAKIFVELVGGLEWVNRYRKKNKIVFQYLNYSHVRSASVPVVPAEKCSLDCCSPNSARGRDSDLSGELLICSIKQLIIAIRLRIVSKIGLSTSKPLLGITIHPPSHSIHRKKKTSNHSSTTSPHSAKQCFDNSTPIKSSPGPRKASATVCS